MCSQWSTTLLGPTIIVPYGPQTSDPYEDLNVPLDKNIHPCCFKSFLDNCYVIVIWCHNFYVVIVY